MHGFSQDEAAARIADFIETSGATLSRLEKLDHAPTSKKRRRLAWALCVSYGVSPDYLGLTDHDRPPLVVVTAIFRQKWNDLTEPSDETLIIHGASSSVQLAFPPPVIAV